MNWTAADLANYAKRRLKDEAPARAQMQHENHNPSQGPCATEPERNQGNALVNVAPRETASSTGDSPRFIIRYIVRSRRPADWDNLACGIKPIQDLLVKALGILPDDRWDVLQGHISSEKAASAEDEGTTVIIERLCQ